MPQSAVRSYFKEQSAAKWELHIPEDAIARESHRWPIGFVTTGFVRGRLVYISFTTWQLCTSVCLHCSILLLFIISILDLMCSKKPVAEAICEAVCLARLREEQWNNMSRKRRKEIYVLVRNLRSSSYRIALATIVLEQQEEDVEFM